MVVNFEYNFVFIHIPKAAGTSITRMLGELKGSGGRSKLDIRRFLKTEILAKNSVSKETKHETYNEFIEHFERRTGRGKELACGLLPIAFTRHPIDRFASLHRYLIQKHRAKYPNVPIDINDFAALIEQGNHPWLDSIRSLKPQSDFLDGIPNRCFIGRYECLADDVLKLSSMLGANLDLPHLNVSANDTLSSTLTDETKRIIFRRYERDFAHFKYASECQH